MKETLSSGNGYLLLSRKDPAAYFQLPKRDLLSFHTKTGLLL